MLRPRGLERLQSLSQLVHGLGATLAAATAATTATSSSALKDPDHSEAAAAAAPVTRVLLNARGIVNDDNDDERQW